MTFLVEQMRSARRPFGVFAARAAVFAVIAGFLFLVFATSKNEFRSDELEAAAGIARLYCDIGNYEEGMALYSGLLEKSGGSAYVRLGLAAALFEQGRFEEAEAHYRVLYRDDPASPVAIFNLAKTLRELHKEESERLFREFIALHGETLPGLAAVAESSLRGEAR